MDKTVDPGSNFFLYAAGGWIKTNPVPANKARWTGFYELQERNWILIQDILQSCSTGIVLYGTPAQKVGDFFRSVMDTNRLETQGFSAIHPELTAIERVSSPQELLRVVAEFHERGIDTLYGRHASPDEKNSAFYTFYLGQGGLGLPDRDYYLTDAFTKQRQAYQAHISRMFALLGDSAEQAASNAATVLQLETGLARISKPRVDLRDPIANYHRYAVSDLPGMYGHVPLIPYLGACGLEKSSSIVIAQPEFFQGLDTMLKDRPLSEWKTYLRWHVLQSSSPFLHTLAEDEWFAFYGKTLRGQLEPEPRWQRAARMIDAGIGEALGQLYVQRHFPPIAKERMSEMIENIKAVFRDRLQRLDWMTEETRARALAKFEKFTAKIGHPDHFRDYGPVAIKANDLLGNVRRAASFESRRQLARVGLPVDRSEWGMTPQTVNAYFSPTQNEIVFPAGILQPPFFDLEMDDAVNYGAIGMVIGHEITHGYDDQGRKYNADGNLADWWTEADAKAFEQRAKLLVDQYNSYEVLPGLKVNGQLTLGENIADLGGASIAFEALQRALQKDPSKRKKIDDFTPEQRFFLSLSQLWRINCREEEMRRLVTVDVHSPGQFRGLGPHVNLDQFYEAFGIKETAPIWRAPELRAHIW
jgi:putative endopeptidase